LSNQGYSTKVTTNQYSSEQGFGQGQTNTQSFGQGQTNTQSYGQGQTNTQSYGQGYTTTTGPMTTKTTGLN
jgi:hypothetical protein